MAQPSPLNSSLIRKGEAKAVSPEVAAGVAPSPAQAMSSPSAPASAVGAAPAPAPPQPDTQPMATRAVREPPEIILGDVAIPDTVPRSLVSFRAPLQLVEELRVMAFETRRPKQELLTEFMSEGLKRWKAARVKRGR